jgi:hypothetical protein
MDDEITTCTLDIQCPIRTHAYIKPSIMIHRGNGNFFPFFIKECMSMYFFVYVIVVISCPVNG